MFKPNSERTSKTEIVCAITCHTTSIVIMCSLLKIFCYCKKCVFGIF